MQISRYLQGYLSRRVSHLDSLKPKITVAILVKGIIGFIFMDRFRIFDSNPPDIYWIDSPRMGFIWQEDIFAWDIAEPDLHDSPCIVCRRPAGFSAVVDSVRRRHRAAGRIQIWCRSLHLRAIPWRSMMSRGFRCTWSRMPGRSSALPHPDLQLRHHKGLIRLVSQWFVIYISIDHIQRGVFIMRLHTIVMWCYLHVIHGYDHIHRHFSQDVVKRFAQTTSKWDPKASLWDPPQIFRSRVDPEK